jgi:hypothetical protein
LRAGLGWLGGGLLRANPSHDEGKREQQSCAEEPKSDGTKKSSAHLS